MSRDVAPTCGDHDPILRVSLSIRKLYGIRMNTATGILERHASFLGTLAFLESRTPADLDRVDTRFDAIVPMVRELRLERQLLPDSVPVYWTPETGEAVAAIAPSIDLTSVECDRHLVYCDRACCWFERPIVVLHDQHGSATPIELVSWWFVQFKDVPDAPIQYGLGVTGWGRHVDNSHLTPTVWIRARAGQLLANAIDYEESGYRACAVACVQFAVAAGMFMRQKIAITETWSVTRHERKRLAAAGWTREPVLSVVHLRARENAPRSDPDDVTVRTFRFRWIVKSHVRQQWYPSLSKHLPVLIGPHIKGPDDRPFKPRTAPLVIVDR